MSEDKNLVRKLRRQIKTLSEQLEEARKSPICACGHTRDEHYMGGECAMDDMEILAPCRCPGYGRRFDQPETEGADAR